MDNRCLVRDFRGSGSSNSSSSADELGWGGGSGGGNITRMLVCWVGRKFLYRVNVPFMFRYIIHLHTLGVHAWILKTKDIYIHIYICIYIYKYIHKCSILSKNQVNDDQGVVILFIIGHCCGMVWKNQWHRWHNWIDIL